MRISSFGTVMGALLATGCMAGGPFAVPPADLSAELEIQAPIDRPIQALAHRWTARDVYQYEVTLKRWNGSEYQDLSPSLTVVVPQRPGAAARATFAHLVPGGRYQAAVIAKGNVGGSAPTTVLNRQAASTATFDFTTLQDANTAATRSVTVALDNVRFAGNMTVLPSGAPRPVDYYDLTLYDSDAATVSFNAQFQNGKTMVLSNLRAGVHYSLVLVARRTLGSFAKAAAPVPIYYDPLATDLEVDATMSVPF